MTLEELREVARDRLADRASPPLWSDTELNGFFVEAEEEACARAHLLIDSQDAMCTLTFEAGDAFVSLDPRIIYAKRIMLTGEDEPVNLYTAEYMDASFAGWEAETDSTIKACVVGLQANALRLYPTPTVGGTLRLTVVRLPLFPLDISNEPEISAQNHIKLVPWAIYRAYLKNDADTLQPERSKTALEEFTSYFGVRVSATTVAEAVTMFSARKFRRG